MDTNYCGLAPQTVFNLIIISQGNTTLNLVFQVTSVHSNNLHTHTFCTYNQLYKQQNWEDVLVSELERSSIIFVHFLSCHSCSIHFRNTQRHADQEHTHCKHGSIIFPFYKIHFISHLYKYITLKYSITSMLQFKMNHLK